MRFKYASQISAFLFFPTLSLHAEVIPEKVFTAQTRKLNIYVDDGLIVGGHREISHVVIKGIRHAENKDYDRVVIDLEGTINGESAVIPRPPYFQANVENRDKKIILSIWGNPQLDFDSKQLHSRFSESALIDNITLFPPELEKDVWTFTIDLKSESRVEIFELSNPTRIIIDIQNKKD